MDDSQYVVWTEGSISGRLTVQSVVDNDQANCRCPLITGGLFAVESGDDPARHQRETTDGTIFDGVAISRHTGAVRC